MNILIVRNDKLGDFVLTLPCYALLKKAYPHATITVLVPEYTADLARYSNTIDHVISDDGQHSLKSFFNLVRVLHATRFNAVITLFSTTRIGLAVFLARIRYRLAPATKLAQLFYNHRLLQKRSRSEKPESEYNLDLIRKFLKDHNIYSNPVVKPPYIEMEQNEVSSLKTYFLKSHGITTKQKLIFIHAGSGGSANNLSIVQFAQLANYLQVSNKYTFVLTAGPGEIDRVRELSGKLKNIKHVVYESNEGLISFAKHVAFANLFISGSTGTLHLAGALNIPTAAFYTRRQSATSLRWQTLNSVDRRLAFSPPEDAEPEDMSKVDIAAAAHQIREKFLTD